MSDTPRTDAKKLTFVARYPEGFKTTDVFADYDTSCELERENTKLKQQRDELLEAVKKFVKAYDSSELLEDNEFESFRAAIANAKQQ